MSTHSTERSELDTPQSKVPIHRRDAFRIPASSTINSKQTLASTSTRINQQEFLELADCYYSNPESAFVRHSWWIPVVTSAMTAQDLTCSHRDIPSKTFRRSTTHWVNSGQCKSGSNPEIGKAQVSCRTAERDLRAMDDAVPVGSEDEGLLPLNFDSSEGWLEYMHETQSLHTIKGSDDFPDPSSAPNRSFFTQAFPSPSSLRTSISTSMISVVPPSISATSFMTYSCLGSLFSFFKRQKSQQPTPGPNLRRRLQRKGRMRIATRPGSTRSETCSSRRRSFVVMDSTLPSDAIIRQTRLPSSSFWGRGSSSSTSVHDLDYDYKLAVDVLVHGAPSSAIPQNMT